jgi:hypothetical protein
MRSLVFVLSLCLCGLAVGVTAQPSAADVQKRFIGHWRLVTFENFDAKGVATVAAYDGGRIMYDAAGNMSAQLMRSNRTRLTPGTPGQPSPTSQAERAAAYATYTAYYGKYSINPATSAVTHHVEGSVNPNWVKTDLVRYYAFSADGNRLMLSLKNGEGRVTGTLTWERLK